MSSELIPLRCRECNTCYGVHPSGYNKNPNRRKVGHCRCGEPFPPIEKIAIWNRRFRPSYSIGDNKNGEMVKDGK